FCIALGAGIVIGFLMGTRPKLDRWLDPWLVVFLNLPALVLIVLCYLWIGLNEIAAITAVALNKIPGVASIIREGARALQSDLKSMAIVFRVRPATYLRHFVVPQLAPFIAGASRSGIAVIWKVVLVVEFLGRSNGIGFQVHLYFQLFDVAMVLVYSLSFIIFMLAIEWFLLQPIENKVQAWRHA
ncbi:MAG: ABC transporter permease subunit, partial [Hyphomicrobiales bacterium]